MTKHFILNLDPDARYEWEQCTLRDPMTAEHPALADLVAAAVGAEAGAYLVAVNIEVVVLEKAPAQSPQLSATARVELPTRTQVPQLAEVA